MSMATTDSSGRFAFEDMEPKRYRVTFQKAAYQVETRELTAAEESDVRVELKRGEGIELEAKDGIFATPLRGLFVRVVDGSGNAAFAAASRSTATAAARCRRSSPGVYELRAESSGYAPVSAAERRRARRARSACCSRPAARSRSRPGPRRSRCRRPTGRLIGADGRPYMWSAFTPDGKIRLSGPVRRLENVAPGRYTFEVEGGVRRDVTVNEGGRAVVSLP